jgi:hypothetical protein
MEEIDAQVKGVGGMEVALMAKVKANLAVAPRRGPEEGAVVYQEP